jgi:hypothetical protein
MGRRNIDWSRAIPLVADGACGADIARHLGCTPSAVYIWAARIGVALPHGHKAAAERVHGISDSAGRTEKMVSMYRQGLTLDAIGRQYGITRERVRQILKKAGVTSLDGGKHVRCEIKKANRSAAMEARIRAKYGVSFDEWRQLSASRITHAYIRQRQSAAARGIEWRLTFFEWLSVWRASGKLEQRGRGKGKYCMSRIKDGGPYAIGNVHVQPCEVNSSEATEKWIGKTKEHRGVFHLYPGLSKPFVVKVKGKSVGRFATCEEAVAARDRALAELQPA